MHVVPKTRRQAADSAASTCFRKSRTRALQRMEWRNSLRDTGGVSGD